MQISGINNVNNISSIYTYGNSNFNQVQNSPVTPVKKINRTPAVEEQENKAKYAVVYGDDKTSETQKKRMKLRQDMQMCRTFHITTLTIHTKFQKWREMV